MSVFLPADLIQKIKDSDRFNISNRDDVVALINFIRNEVTHSSSCACLQLIGTQINALYAHAYTNEQTCDYKRELEVHLRQCLNKCSSADDAITFTKKFDNFPVRPNWEYDMTEFREYTQKVYRYLNEELLPVGPCGCIGAVANKLTTILETNNLEGMDYEKEIRQSLLDCVQGNQPCNIIAPGTPTANQRNHDFYFGLLGTVIGVLSLYIIYLKMKKKNFC